MVQVVIVRHAQSVGNQFGIRQGQMDFPLSEKGLEQCKSLPSTLSEYDISKIYSSDLRRAKETVMYSGISDELEHEESDLIREFDFGDFNGTVVDYDDSDALPYALDEHPKLGEPWPNGESYIEAYNRVRAFCQKLVVEHDEDETVAVVLHQGTLMTVRDLANGIAPLESDYDSVPNLGGFVFEMTSDRYGIDGELDIVNTETVHSD